MSLESAVERLLALSRVENYSRRGPNGQMIQVKGYDKGAAGDGGGPAKAQFRQPLRDGDKDAFDGVTTAADIAAPDMSALEAADDGSDAYQQLMAKIKRGANLSADDVNLMKALIRNGGK